MSINSITSGTALQQALFEYADKDKSGSLSSTELQSVAGAVLGTTNPTADQVSALESQLDTNGDGSVSESEFLQSSVVTANLASLLSGGTMSSLLDNSDSSSTDPFSALTGASSTNPYAALAGGDSSDALSSLLGGDSNNPYSALPGYSSGTDITNLYGSLIGTSLSGLNNSTGDLTGQLLEGALSSKGLLV